MPEKKTNIQSRLDQIRTLPTLPKVLTRLQRAVANPRTNAEQLARIVEDDPAMMARILKVVNSPLYATSERINSLQLAISRMGLNAISNIALSTSVLSTFKVDAGTRFDGKEFWRHSIATGIGTNAVYDLCKANINGRYTKDILHLAGLLHDIGKIVFLQNFQAEFVTALQACRDRDVPLFILEPEIIGADHAQVGAWLGDKWRLSQDMIDVIRWHHEPANAGDSARELTMICHIANYACNIARIGESGDAVTPAFFHGVWKHVGLEPESLSAIIQQIEDGTAHSEVLLSLT